MKRRLLFLSMAVLMAGGCVTVEPWERDLLAVGPMQMSDGMTQSFERNSESYREGAVGANGGKAGGGCGCS